MKAIIKVSVPTSYQYSSMRAFNLRNQSNPGGAWLAWEEFESVKDARSYLNSRAAYLYDGDKKQIAKNMGADYLEYDSATAWIITGFERSEFLESVK